jgi:hypothetical protein
MKKAFLLLLLSLTMAQPLMQSSGKRRPELTGLKKKEMEARLAQQAWGREIVGLKIDQEAKNLNE